MQLSACAHAFLTSDNDQCRLLIEALGALTSSEDTLHPLLLALVDFLPQVHVFIGQGFQDPAAPSDLIAIHQHKAAGLGELGTHIKGDGVPSPQGDFPSPCAG